MDKPRREVQKNKRISLRSQFQINRAFWYRNNWHRMRYLWGYQDYGSRWTLAHIRVSKGLHQSWPLSPEDKKKGPPTICGYPLLRENSRPGNLPGAGERRPRVQLAVGVALGHLGDRDRRVVLAVSGLAELGHALGHDFLHGIPGRLHVVAGIDLLPRVPQNLAEGAGDGGASVGAHVGLGHAVLVA